MSRLFINVKEELHQIEKEISKVSSNLTKAHRLKDQKEYQATLWMLRNTLEGICKNLYLNEISSNIPALELRQLIKELEELSIIPPHILPHIRSVQTFGNYGSHTRDGYEENLEEVHILPALSSMDIIFNWFTKTYHGYNPEQDDLSDLLKYYPFYNEDISVNEAPWITDSYVGPKTIIIALGSHTCFELFDRIPAEILRKCIDEEGDYVEKKRAVIVTDIWYQRDKALHDKFVISYGKQGTTWATDLLISRNPGTLLPAFSDDNCKVINSDGNIIFASEIPGGALEATVKFIKSKDGLSLYLKNVWKV